LWRPRHAIAVVQCLDLYVEINALRASCGLRPNIAASSRRCPDRHIAAAGFLKGVNQVWDAAAMASPVVDDNQASPATAPPDDRGKAHHVSIIPEVWRPSARYVTLAKK
jgi:hypothetical protein